MLKEKHEIENYEEKAKVLRENGWETWYHDDNWIKTEWIEQGRKYDMMGRSTDDVYHGHSDPTKMEDAIRIIEEIIEKNHETIRR